MMMIIIIIIVVAIAHVKILKFEQCICGCEINTKHFLMLGGPKTCYLADF